VSSPIEDLIAAKTEHESKFNLACYIGKNLPKTQDSDLDKVIIKPIASNPSRVDLWVGNNHVSPNRESALEIMRGLAYVFGL